MPQPVRLAWSSTDRPQPFIDAGLPVEAAREYAAGYPELTWTADLSGQLVTDLVFRVPLLTWADARGGPTWLYDFRWPAPGLGLGLTIHCLDLPFTWDLLGADGVVAVTGPHPPQPLADQMHASWVSFITAGEPGWSRWDGGNAHVFGATAVDTYAASRALGAALTSAGIR
jgi:para-nitrobenzyl esterase